MAIVPFTSLLTGSSTPFLASGDVLVFVDVSDTTQSANGSTVRGTLTEFFAQLPVPVAILSTSATAFTVGRLGATTPAFQVDASTASQVAGLKLTGAATGGTVAVVVIDSGSNANLTINAKGTGTIGIGSVSTGRVTITPVCTITGALTLSSSLAVATSIAVGTNPASTGAIRLPSGSAIYTRNAANDGDIVLLNTDASNVIYVGNSAAAYIHTANRLLTLASAAGKAGLCLPHGTAPTSPVNGDMWTTTAGLYVRIDGVTQSQSSYLPLAGGTITGALTVTGDITGTLVTAVQPNITSMGDSLTFGNGAAVIRGTKTTGVTGPTRTPIQTFSGSTRSAWLEVHGTDGTNKFCDVILAVPNAGVTPEVVAELTEAGSPAARTYDTTSTSVGLKMASGTYTIAVAAIMADVA